MEFSEIFSERKRRKRELTIALISLIIAILAAIGVLNRNSVSKSKEEIKNNADSTKQITVITKPEDADSNLFQGPVIVTDSIKKKESGKTVASKEEDSSVTVTKHKAEKIDTKNKSAPDDTFEVSISDLRQSECEIYLSDFQSTYLFGQACFENRTEYDLVLTVGEMGATGGLIQDKILLRRGGKNCCPRIRVATNWSGSDKKITVKDIRFIFTTINATPTKKGTLVMTLEKCKVKSVVLTNDNLYLEVVQ